MGRRRFIINPSFQYRFLASALAMAAMVLAVVYVANLVFFKNLLERGLSAGLPADHVFFRFLDEQRALMSRVFLGVAALITVLIGAWGIWFSHRIAGPLYRLRVFFGSAAAGPMEPLRFRKGDFFLEIPGAVNAFLGSRKWLRAAAPPAGQSAKP